MSDDVARARRDRLVLWALALAAFVVGVWATADPASFYADFVLGRQWVALDGRLVRAVAVATLAYAVYEPCR